MSEQIMTENAVTAEGAPPPADLSDADRSAQQLIKSLQVMFAELTGWRVWASDSGTLYATRNIDLTADEISDGLEMTVVHEDPHELLTLIKQQVQQSARRAAEKAERLPSGL